MIQSITLDVLKAVKATDFFTLSQAKRNAAVKEQLAGYPKPILSYLLQVDEFRFVEDVEALLPVLGSSSVIAEAKQLAKTENGFFASVLNSLNALRSVTAGETALAEQVRWFKEASAMYGRVFDRELQLLLLEARGEDSPIAQLATDVEVDVSALSGVPSVQVQRSLLGGSRVFHNGGLTDQSWRARLTKILSAVS